LANTCTRIDCILATACTKNTHGSTHSRIYSSVYVSHAPHSICTIEKENVMKKGVLVISVLYSSSLLSHGFGSGPLWSKQEERTIRCCIKLEEIGCCHLLLTAPYVM